MSVNFDDLIHAKLVDDLVTCQKHLISLQLADNGVFFIVMWMDCSGNNARNSWLWLSVDPDLAIQYITGKVSLYDCMTAAELMVQETQCDNEPSIWKVITKSEWRGMNVTSKDSYITGIMNDDVNVDCLVQIINELGGGQ